MALERNLASQGLREMKLSARVTEQQRCLPGRSSIEQWFRGQRS